MLSEEHPIGASSCSGSLAFLLNSDQSGESLTSLFVKCDAVEQSSLLFPHGLLTLCLNLLITDKCIVSCRCFFFFYVHILYIYWLSFCTEWMKTSRGKVVICSFIFGRARYISDRLLQCITIYHVHSWFPQSSEDWHSRICVFRLRISFVLCVCVWVCELSCMYVCVCVWVCCRSLTILWMNRSPRMFFNVWASYTIYWSCPVICIFVTDLCYSTVNKKTLPETLVDRTKHFSVLFLLLLSVIIALQM